MRPLASPPFVVCCFCGKRKTETKSGLVGSLMASHSHQTATITHCGCVCGCRCWCLCWCCCVVFVAVLCCCRVLSHVCVRCVLVVAVCFLPFLNLLRRVCMTCHAVRWTLALRQHVEVTRFQFTCAHCYLCDVPLCPSYTKRTFSSERQHGWPSSGRSQMLPQTPLGHGQCLGDWRHEHVPIHLTFDVALLVWSRLALQGMRPQRNTERNNRVHRQWRVWG